MCSQVCHKSTNCACVQVLFRTLLVPPLHRCATRRALSKSGPSLSSFVICMSAVELWFGLKRISVFKQSKTLSFPSFFFTITRCILLLHNHTVSSSSSQSHGVFFFSFTITRRLSVKSIAQVRLPRSLFEALITTPRGLLRSAEMVILSLIHI